MNSIPFIVMNKDQQLNTLQINKLIEYIYINIIGMILYAANPNNYLNKNYNHLIIVIQDYTTIIDNKLTLTII